MIKNIVYNSFQILTDATIKAIKGWHSELTWASVSEEGDLRNESREMSSEHFIPAGDIRTLKLICPDKSNHNKKLQHKHLSGTQESVFWKYVFLIFFYSNTRAKFQINCFHM